MLLACAWRTSRLGSVTSSGRQTARTPGSSAGLSAISGPMPAGSPVAMAMIGLRWWCIRFPAAVSHPRHQRGMDHVRHALATDRLDRKVDVVEPEAMGRDLLQRKAVRGELFERKLAGLV